MDANDATHPISNLAYDVRVITMEEARPQANTVQNVVIQSPRAKWHC